MTDKIRLIAFWSLIALWFALTFSSALTEVFFTICLIFTLIYLLQTRSWPLESVPKTPKILLLGYCLLVILSYFWSEFPQLSFRGVFKVLQQVSIVVLASSLLSSSGKLLRWFELITIAIAGFLCVNGYYQYFVGVDMLRGFPMVSFSEGGRVSSSFKIYTMFAAYLILIIPYLFFLAGYRIKDKKMQLLTCLILGMSLFLLAMTRSRGAILAFCISIFIILLFKKQFKLFLFGGLVIAAVIPFIPRSHLLHLDIDGKEQSIVERLYLWNRAIDVIKAKPLTGTGINTYNESHAKYDQTHSWRVKSYYAHNGYLQLAAETGVPSLLCLIFFLMTLAGHTLKIYRQSHHKDRHMLIGLAAGIIGFLILAAGDTVFHSPQPSMLFWFMMGVAITYSSRYASDQIDIRKPA